jgi:hypothetical protein
MDTGHKTPSGIQTSCVKPQAEGQEGRDQAAVTASDVACQKTLNQCGHALKWGNGALSPVDPVVQPAQGAAHGGREGGIGGLVFQLSIKPHLTNSLLRGIRPRWCGVVFRVLWRRKAKHAQGHAETNPVSVA